MIPYGRQDISEDDIAAVKAVLCSDWLTQGPAVQRFERTVADLCGARHAVATSSATAALHLAYRALGLGPGDILWTSPNSFVATANAALFCGATVDFVDIDPLTYSLSPAALQSKLAAAKRDGRLPKIVVPVHFAGQPCDMTAIWGLAQHYGFRVVEDASHAIGAQYQGHHVGACAQSDMAVFSFHPVKIITTGEGGMVLARGDDMKEALQLLRSHGITRDSGKMQGESEGAWYYQQIDLGYNYRMTDIQAALGASQMLRLSTFLDRRHALARRYDAALVDLPIQLPVQSHDCYSALHLYPIRLKLDEIGLTRRQVFDRLREAGVGVNVHYIPIHLQPYYRTLGFQHGDFPEAERYYAGALSLPLYFGLSETEQDHVIAAVTHILA